MKETEAQNDEKTTMGEEEEEHKQPTENINTPWKVVTAKRPHQTDSNSDPLTIAKKTTNKNKTKLECSPPCEETRR